MRRQRSSYELRIRAEINEIIAEAYDDINVIASAPLETGLKVLTVLLESACHGQNIGPIVLVRDLLKNISSEWLYQHLPVIVRECIDLDDEWEYRRLLEVVQETVPLLLKEYVLAGLHSKNEEVREAAEDYVVMSGTEH
ncbi:hypothetical protein E8L90_00965 [Brevibacillus antibioticus]|uniref:Immunity protein 30 domain-containing protein n=1 Tax=Brevibacillus antibioticus TaxID=2570228 RepID=A0A4U2Y3E1_9BACL|nr:hypothetical protein [Brevibacillus antibioticus]TKI54132.1 hypothetical protein E8L90_00965 [Brevibacillus antibioticus]